MFISYYIRASLGRLYCGLNMETLTLSTKYIYGFSYSKHDIRLPHSENNPILQHYNSSLSSSPISYFTQTCPLVSNKSFHFFQVDSHQTGEPAFCPFPSTHSPSQSHTNIPQPSPVRSLVPSPALSARAPPFCSHSSPVPNGSPSAAPFIASGPPC